MCLILIAKNSHPQWNLVIAANRDEFYQRPASNANYWQDRPHLLAGRDLSAGGTWLGVDQRGRVAALTNVRKLPLEAGACSRGELVCQFLDHDNSAANALHGIHGEQYGGFNLLVDDGLESYCHSNCYSSNKLTDGIHGLCNATLNTPWPKTERGKRLLNEALQQQNLVPALFEILTDQYCAADDMLPDTGVGIELERVLAPIFIQSPDYGTRVSTVILRSEQQLVFIERGYDANKKTIHEVDYVITLN